MFKERIYKIWKQFTTQRAVLAAGKILCSKNEYTKSESNSQHGLESWIRERIVFKERIYKIWKQFTTSDGQLADRRKLCSKNEYTKSESNSQRTALATTSDGIVFKELIYKIWKQFTTSCANTKAVVNCVQRTNIQNLKAIHNHAGVSQVYRTIVFKERIYKIWKQFTT